MSRVPRTGSPCWRIYKRIAASTANGLHPCFGEWLHHKDVCFSSQGTILQDDPKIFHGIYLDLIFVPLNHPNVPT